VVDWVLNTPVAFIIFNRPETTARVFAEIARVRPPSLLVIADGPRAARAGEAEKCAAARAIIQQVDWACEVLTNFSDVNLGCKNRVASGIDWVFEQVPEAIMLEDDCLPHPTFFRFCEELLERYRDDRRVSQIGGTNFQFGRNRPQASYYFSRYNHIWGWASWRRAWRAYDRTASIWPQMRDEQRLNAIISRSGERRFWNRAFEAVYRGRVDTWDLQWTLAAWAQNMVSIVPEVNLVSNIGFGADATHTRGTNIYAAMDVSPMNFPLRHPQIVLPASEADAYTAKRMFTRSLVARVMRRAQGLARRVSTGVQ
jgi:hypothetical protein